MFFQLQVFLHSLIFFSLLEFISSDIGSGGLEFVSSNIFWLAFAFLITFLYFFQTIKKISKRTNMAPMPIVFVASTMGLLYFVQSIKQQNLLIFLSATAYYFILLSLYRLKSYSKDQTARGIIAAGCVATIFLFYATSYGIYLNFAIPLWVLMGILMIITTLISFQYLWLSNESQKNVLNYSLVLGFVMAEIVWVLNFWPFGYLTTGVIALIFYYVFWDMVQSFFMDELTKKRIISNLIIFGFLIAMVLTSTRWLPVV